MNEIVDLSSKTCRSKNETGNKNEMQLQLSNSNQKPKLYYFNVTGLAEPIRYLLHYCNIEFEDIRFADFDEWINNYKNDMPMEQVPVLEIDGVKYHQHKSICEYIAKIYRLCGSTEKESLEMSALVDDFNDMRAYVANYYKEDDAIFKSKLKERMEDKLPFFMNKFESRIVENRGFFFNGKISWVDIYYSGVCEVISNILQRDLNEAHPNLKSLVDYVRKIDRIKKYIDLRPQTPL
ncbi:hypothetical protein QAD02_011567 [Eretmocerus hayati]|uniref:Uncharacterized protein n=1 Tax=Eretmocerus hayati TaxID=131215 RepID=A0ACC2NYA4_9HYME|nr:hypothetical protein QAD02_011567 [Eretmocerus hayati]